MRLITSGRPSERERARKFSVNDAVRAIVFKQKKKQTACALWVLKQRRQHESVKRRVLAFKQSFESQTYHVLQTHVFPSIAREVFEI